MRSASVSVAKNSLSALLRRVQRGETILITDRGVPIARLEPVTAAGAPAALATLVREGLLTPAKRSPTLDVLDLPLPAVSRGISASALLIEERESGH
jgi:prevent-host-death family protein